MAFSLPRKSPLLQTKGISEPFKVPQVRLSVISIRPKSIKSARSVIDCNWSSYSETVYEILKYCHSISKILNRRALNCSA